MKKRILSGMRPTGKLHIGHLKGALENWVKLQDEYDCFYMIADWHALTTEYESSKEIHNYSIEIVKFWIATGIDEKKSVIFRQSDVHQHAELHLVFSMFTPLGWLFRCPTYKEQLREIKERDLKTYGFLGYPVLQAADILIYKAERVPVGEDQVPHIELTREIARRFNYLYGKVFPEPKEILTPSARIPGIDGRKMSKSLNNCIYLDEEKNEIYKKVNNMITDPQRIRKTDKGHPDICTVFSYYKVFSPEILDKVRNECENAKIGCVECKKRLANILERVISPIREKKNKIKDEEVIEILKEGKKKASKIAEETLNEVKKAIFQ
ncbi:MAG: tryptophan--tRNA ligase [Caldiserica bacterium]|nr:MAG: tryptophan--tRNA ligase [Caldisericota bacterium]